jgi:hypothetical protein
MRYRYPLYKFSEETGFSREEPILAIYDPEYVEPPKPSFWKRLKEMSHIMFV